MKMFHAYNVFHGWLDIAIYWFQSVIDITEKFGYKEGQFGQHIPALVHAAIIPYIGLIAQNWV